MPTQTIEGFPLSLQQKRCWSLIDRDSRAELRTEAECLIQGGLQRANLETALRRVVRRHEICRCRITETGGVGEPLQVVAENSEHNVGGFNWGLRSESDGIHFLWLRFPAALADSTSIGLFVRELACEYEKANRGDDSEEPMQYPDYAQWQLELQSSPEARAGHQFWSNIGPVDAVVPLENSCAGFQAGCETGILDAAAYEQLQQCAKVNGADASAVIAAAWMAFLGRLIESRSDLVVGINTPGRTFEELEEALGLYDRYLPVQVALKSSFSADEVIQRMSNALSSAGRHQEFFGGPGSTEIGPLPFLFTHRSGVSEVGGDNMRFQVRRMESHTEPFKLKLELIDAALPELRLYYNARLFSAEYAAVIAKRFKTFLNEFITRHGAPMSALKCICAREWETVVERFPRAGSARPRKPTVIDLFAGEVEQHPQRPAVICGGAILTYAELNQRANRLARRLQKLGVSRGGPVAISAERSVEMIVGLLGIQKAGGAYVPLDPGYPKDRLAFVLRDCGAQVLVAQQHLWSKLPDHDCSVVGLGAGGADLSDESCGDPGVQLNPEHAAYIIYTSGSTGQPKGVQISHANLACSTAARFDYYREPIANYLLLSSFAFDSSIAGIFWTLAQGGTLTIPREGTHQDPRELLHLIREYKVSHLLALPSFYSAILDQAREGELRSLTTAIVAGEACSVELVHRHHAKLPQATLFNEYGPTEGTVWATVHRCDPSEHAMVAIGRPVPNMSVYILDEERKAVGIGQTGEICIGGPAVARGYLHRDELTREKFVANPFFQTAGNGLGEVPEILYRTGDLGRFRLDGSIEFHGRIDEQVKIRGHRIEIGEIENVLAAHPAVREAVVVAREDFPGEKRLVGYIVARDEARFSIPDFRMFAQERLPQFMVPAQFALVPALPLTPNGKIDRKALPAPEELERGEGRFLAPRTADEEQLARIWSEVLKLEKVGLGENFFELGGHSLLAIQVIARVRDCFKVDFPMAAFFEAPTIDGMAVALGRFREKNGEPKRNYNGTGEIRRAARVAASDQLLQELNRSTD